MSKKYLGLSLVLAILMVFAAIPVTAYPPAPDTEKPPGPIDSLGNVIGMDPVPNVAPSMVEPSAAVKILCFTTRTGALDPCARANSLFTDVTIVRSEASFPSRLSAYDVVYLGYGEGDLLDGHSSQLQNYVQAGGGLIVSQPNLVGDIDAYPPGFEMTVTSVAWPEFPNLPGPVEFTRAGARHPILNGLTGGDVSGNFETVPLSTLGPGWSVLVKSVSHPNVALAVGSYGTGRLGFHSGNIAASAADQGSDAYVRQMIEWAGAGGAVGPDMEIDAIEVTQAIQDLNNGVELVANKRTYVRVHVSSPASVSHVFANLSGRRGATTLYPTLSPGNPGTDITVLPSPDRGQLNDSFWFELPASWLAPGSLTLTARLDPADAKNDPDRLDNVQSVTVNLIDSPPLRLRLYNVQYTAGGSTYLAANTHLQALESWLERAYPMPSLNVSRHTFTYPDPGLPDVDTLHGWLALIKLFGLIFGHEDPRYVYYGMVDDGGGFMRGKAAGIPSTIAAGPTGSGTYGWDFDGSYGDWYGGHEIAHTRGRYHAECCGAGGGVAYPYPNCRISPALTGDTALYGFDTSTHAIYGPTWKDLMTYCSNQWVSDFTYEGIRSYMASVGLAASRQPLVKGDRFLLIMGMADLSTGTGRLESVHLIEGQNDLSLPAPGDWTIALMDGSGRDLATHAFAPHELTREDYSIAGSVTGAASASRPAVISEIVPWPAEATRIEIRYGKRVIDARSASANAPRVDITWPTIGHQFEPGPVPFRWSATDADGDPLTFSVAYSNDRGATWEVLTSGIKETELQTHTALLPGGADCLVLVIATDGLLIGMDTAGPFYVPPGVPEVTITSPAEDEVFYPAQMVTLAGSAYDNEDGQLGGDSLRWRSSIDGDLGTGPIVNTVGLSTGRHVITLQATDSDESSGQATRTIEILEGTADEPLDLSVVPASLGVARFARQGPATYPFSLRSSGEQVLEWNAVEDAAWLQLDATSGSTPSDIQLTVDPTGLEPGTYRGALTVRSADARNSPVTVPVVLQVEELCTIYLPIVQRQ